MQTNSQKSETLAALDSMRLLADSPTLLYVLRFAARMEAKLAKNRHKGDRNGWIKCDIDALLRRLDDETEELREATRQVYYKINILPHEREPIINEAADVANFAMMIADKYGLSADDLMSGGCGSDVASAVHKAPITLRYAGLSALPFALMPDVARILETFGVELLQWMQQQKQKWEHGCITGDCPHESQVECWQSLVEDCASDLRAQNSYRREKR